MPAPLLEGLGVVITRPRVPAEALARQLAAEGARTFVFPALEIESIPATPALEAALDSLAHCDLAIFVSAHAVEKGLEAVRRRGSWPVRTRVAAVGEATAQALRSGGFAAVISPAQRHDSDALLARAELHAVEGQNIIVFRGEGGRERLREVLESRGARVAYAECYRRVRAASDPRPLLDAWSRGEVHAVNAMSAETLAHFVAMIGEEGRGRLAEAALVVPHEAIGGGPEARRFGRIIVAAPGSRGIAVALATLKDIR